MYSPVVPKADAVAGLAPKSELPPNAVLVAGVEPNALVDGWVPNALAVVVPPNAEVPPPPNAPNPVAGFAAPNAEVPPLLPNAPIPPFSSRSSPRIQRDDAPKPAPVGFVFVEVAPNIGFAGCCCGWV